MLSCLRFATAVGAVAAAAVGCPTALAATPGDGRSSQTRYVSTRGDDTDGCTAAAPCATVQHAVDVATSGDTISIAPGRYAQNVVVAGKSLTLLGAGSRPTTLTGHSVDGVTVTVRGTGAVAAPTVTITHLDVSDNVANPGLEVDSGTVRALHSTVDGNVDYGAVVYSPGSLTMNDTVVDANNGAGIAVFGGSLSLSRATVSGNVAQASDENASQGGVSVQTGSARIVDSTLGANGGAGVYVAGGTAPASAALVDTTLDGNTGAGVYASHATVSVTSSTIAGTRSLPAAGVPGLDAAGGIVRADGSSTARVTTSIVAQQQGVPDCHGTVVDRGYDLSSDAANSCRFGAAQHSRARSHAVLGKLGHHGGVTWTRVPGAGSAALGVIPRGRADCVPGARDQRGVRRLPRNTGRCDIGAVERTG